MSRISWSRNKSNVSDVQTCTSVNTQRMALPQKRQTRIERSKMCDNLCRENPCATETNDTFNMARRIRPEHSEHTRKDPKTNARHRTLTQEETPQTTDSSRMLTHMDTSSRNAGTKGSHNCTTECINSFFRTDRHMMLTSILDSV